MYFTEGKARLFQGCFGLLLQAIPCILSPVKPCAPWLRNLTIYTLEVEGKKICKIAFLDMKI